MTTAQRVRAEAGPGAPGEHDARLADKLGSRYAEKALVPSRSHRGFVFAPACDWLGAAVTEPVLSLLPRGCGSSGLAISARPIFGRSGSCPSPVRKT
jgi:hypothetical protein